MNAHQVRQILRVAETNELSPALWEPQFPEWPPRHICSALASASVCSTADLTGNPLSGQRDMLTETARKRMTLNLRPFIRTRAVPATAPPAILTNCVCPPWGNYKTGSSSPKPSTYTGTVVGSFSASRAPAGTLKMPVYVVNTCSDRKIRVAAQWC